MLSLFFARSAQVVYLTRKSGHELCLPSMVAEICYAKCAA
jgi:hypothetical protein